MHEWLQWRAASQHSDAMTKGRNGPRASAPACPASVPAALPHDRLEAFLTNAAEWTNGSYSRSPISVKDRTLQQTKAVILAICGYV